MGEAAAGKRVAVVTIDPARRLAGSLGLEELGNHPQPIDPELFAAAGVEMRGELWAMMLDPKRTFDELIGRLAPDERTRDEVLANRIYQQLSSAVAGSQEYTAMAKLHELDQEGGFDLLVLDTPPSRNALDFLDAPDRLGDLQVEDVAAELAPRLGEELAGRVAENFADYHVLARRDRANIERLTATLEQPRVVMIPHLDEDVHDVEGL